MKSASVKVEMGARVELELINQAGESEHLSLTLTSDEEADFQAGFLGVGTPLAQAILGRQAGETLPYTFGDLQQVRIIAIQPGTQKPDKTVTARRKAAVRKAIQHSDYVNAMIFAGAVNSKWGDYDIDKLDPAQWGKLNDEDEATESTPET
jgi:hypothetical protein